MLNALNTTFITLDSVDKATGRVNTVSGVLSKAGNLLKSNAGMLTLSGANTYTGDTVVSGGDLAVSGNSINDGGKLVIDGGKVDPTGSTEIVDTLVLGGVQQDAGTYGSVASGVANPSNTYFVHASSL